MNVISLKNHVQLTEVKKQKVNELVAQCINTAVANAGSLREVLKGDMRNVALKSSLSKAS